MLRILRETDQYLAVYKPAGMAVQSAHVRQMDLMNQLLNEMMVRQRRLQGAAARGKGSSHPYLALINRLDQPVEGIVLFAKCPGAAAKLSDMLQQHRITKRYLAVVHLSAGEGQQEGPQAMRWEGQQEGPLEGQTEGRWYKLTDYMIRDGRTNMSRIVSSGEPGARKAELQYRIIRRGVSARDDALLEIHLLTGRHHQIRLQLAHAGMPIAGDRKYGMAAYGMEDTDDTTERGTFRSSHVVADRSLALCAAELVFTDPWTREDVAIRVMPEGKYFSDFGCRRESIH